MTLRAFVDTPEIVVDVVAKSWGVDDGEPQSRVALLDVCASALMDGCAGDSALTRRDGFNLHRAAPLRAWFGDASGLVQFSVKEGVDQCGLSQTRLAWMVSIGRVGGLTWLLERAERRLTDHHCDEMEASTV